MKLPFKFSKYIMVKGYTLSKKILVINLALSLFALPLALPFGAPSWRPGHTPAPPPLLHNLTYDIQVVSSSCDEDLLIEPFQCLVFNFLFHYH